jgi:MYXO-CTERM domain-containing protein
LKSGRWIAALCSFLLLSALADAALCRSAAGPPGGAITLGAFLAAAVAAWVAMWRRRWAAP